MYLIVYTGGTIGMVQEEKTGRLVPSDIKSVQSFIEQMNIESSLDITTIEPAIDSSNIQKNHIEGLLEIIHLNYQKYKGFLILMGTDSMAYVSALLSYCIEGLTKPIIFTGSQLPLFEDQTDAKSNLTFAVQGLINNAFPKEVGICFHQKWHRAVQANKVDAQGFDAFWSPNFVSETFKLPKADLYVQKNITANVAVYKCLPYQNTEILKTMLQSEFLDALLIEAFGSGNMPEFDVELKELFQQKIAEGLQVVLLTQCPKGSVLMGAYQTGMAAKELGFLDGKHLTTESALAKISYLISKKLKTKNIRDSFEKSLRGE